MMRLPSIDKEHAMKQASLRVLAGLAAAALSLAVLAQAPAPAGAPKEEATGPMAKTIDCSRARNPERCQQRQQARDACQDLRGPKRRKCTEEHMPPPDCSKTLNPARCNAMLSARAGCKDKVGPEYRQCVTAQLPPLPAAPAPAKP
jgi:hypothetical protein